MHLALQLEEMERMGSFYRPGGLVFANESGGIINPSSLRNRSFTRLHKRAGLSPTARFHDLRHTASLTQRQPQDRLRDAGARLRSHHPRHLQPRTAYYARKRYPRPGRGPKIGTTGNKGAVKEYIGSA